VPQNNETIIKPSILKKLIMVPFFLFAGFFYYWLWNSYFKNPGILVPFVFGIVFITAMLLFVVWMNLLNPRYNYKIILNASQIRIKDQAFAWTELEETCIMTRMEGKYRAAYLLLFTKRNTVEKFDLTNLSTSHQKLASLVEYYKRKNKEPQSIHPG
jgi:hypothetical protein